MFKKTMIVFLVIIVACNLMGCIPVITDEYYEIYQEIDQIKSIALFELNDEEDAKVNELKETPLAEIAEEDFASLVSDLEGMYSKTGFYITIAAQDPSFYFDKYVIRIDYMNGDQEFVSSGGYQEVIVVEGSSKYYHYDFDNEQWDAFLIKYFSIQE